MTAKLAGKIRWNAHRTALGKNLFLVGKLHEDRPGEPAPVVILNCKRMVSGDTRVMLTEAEALNLAANLIVTVDPGRKDFEKVFDAVLNT